jgi:hypothetical protein
VIFGLSADHCLQGNRFSILKIFFPQVKHFPWHFLLVSVY